MLSMISLPMPGQAKTLSVTTAKAMVEPSSRPSTVTTGIMMFFSTWTKITRDGRQPLGTRELHEVHRQRLTNSGAGQPQHQRNVEQRQVQRRQQHVTQSVPGQERPRHAEQSFRLPASGAGQPTQLHREHHDQHQSHPKTGQRKSQYTAGHDGAAKKTVRLKSRVQPQRHTENHRKQHRGDGEFHRRRHALRDQSQRRFVEHETAAQIAMQRVAEKISVLAPQRLIQAHAGDDAGALGLVGLGRDQDVDRIADDVHADEHDDRHRQDDETGLEQSADGPGDHFASRTPIASVASSTRGS